MALPGSPLPTHGNVYCRGWSAEAPLSEADVLSIFSPHGEITSLRLVAGGEGGSAAAPHAFVRYEHAAQAAAAIQALNGTTVAGNQLVVKFADADVQPRVESGRQPSEWSYCRNLPSTYTRQDVGEMFLPFGTVLEIRLFPSTELYKGSGALVQMQSMEQAAAAIQALNGSFPRGATQPLLVRYADSPAEKAAKQARKERLIQKQTTGPSLFGGNTLLAAQLQQQLLGLAIGGSNGRSMGLGNGSMGNSSNSPELSGDLGSMQLSGLDGYGQDGMLPQAVLQQQAVAALSASPGTGASIYIKGMPEDADKLWLYEKFARFGGIGSVRVLIDEQSGKCNGIGFVNYTTADAARLAQEAMNGVSMGDRLLHVMVQNPAARGRTQPGVPSPTMGGGGGGAASNGGLQPMQRDGGGGSMSSMMQAANSLGLNASALANLQAATAGLVPPGSMGLQHAPNGMPLPMAVGGHGGYGGMGHHSPQQPTYANLAQW